MAKFFNFASREVKVCFFDGKDAVTVKLVISDETDQRFVKGAELVERGTKADSIDERKALWLDAVDAIIGAEPRQAILDRAPVQDCFAVAEVYRYLVDAYGGAKVKNLSASVR